MKTETLILLGLGAFVVWHFWSGSSQPYTQGVPYTGQVGGCLYPNNTFLPGYAPGVACPFVQQWGGDGLHI